MKCSVLIESSLIRSEDVRILNDQNSDIHYSLIESSFVWLLRCGVMKNPRQALRLGGGNAYCDCAAGDFSNVSSM